MHPVQEILISGFWQALLTLQVVKPTKAKMWSNTMHVHQTNWKSVTLWILPGINLKTVYEQQGIKQPVNTKLPQSGS